MREPTPLTSEARPDSVRNHLFFSTHPPNRQRIFCYKIFLFHVMSNNELLLLYMYRLESIPPARARLFSGCNEGPLQMRPAGMWPHAECPGLSPT